VTVELSERTGRVVRWEDRVAATSVRVSSPAGSAAAAALLGVELPHRPGTWSPTEDGRVVWLGPDEWLVTAPATGPRSGLDAETRWRSALTPHGGTAVDVSAARVGLRLSGPHARAVLAKGCSIDVHPRSFGPGAGAQTTLGLAGVVLLSLGSTGDEFAVLVRTSFATYLTDWLTDASLEFRS
jgi:sarcosine oxidase subunit gamma